jgi:hypothetical protein
LKFNQDVGNMVKGKGYFLTYQVGTEGIYRYTISVGAITEWIVNATCQSVTSGKQTLYPYTGGWVVLGADLDGL